MNCCEMSLTAYARMNYLNSKELNDIRNSVKLISIEEVDNITNYIFDCDIQEYNDFLYEAKEYQKRNISKTFLLIHLKTNELLGYMSLATDSIKVTNEEKEIHDISNVPFASIPSLKVGKLAINNKLSKTAKRKGYGSFLLDMAKAFAFSLNDFGVACRFLTVDADIDYNMETPIFYKKNGFLENSKYKRNKQRHVISMRKDIFG